MTTHLWRTHLDRIIDDVQRLGADVTCVAAALRSVTRATVVRFTGSSAAVVSMPTPWSEPWAARRSA